MSNAEHLQLPCHSLIAEFQVHLAAAHRRGLLPVSECCALSWVAHLVAVISTGNCIYVQDKGCLAQMGQCQVEVELERNAPDCTAGCRACCHAVLILQMVIVVSTV